jgi:hypothetical protein
MGLSPSRTGLLAQTLWRSPGSRAHCVLTCLDSSTTPSPAATRDLARLADVAFPLTEKGRHPIACFRSSMILPASPLSTLRYDPSRDHRQDSRPEWSRFSFSVGLSHPLQCAGLSRRSLSRFRLPFYLVMNKKSCSPVCYFLSHLVVISSVAHLCFCRASLFRIMGPARQFRLQWRKGELEAFAAIHPAPPQQAVGIRGVDDPLPIRRECQVLGRNTG